MPTMHNSLPLALAVAENAMREISNQWLAGMQPKLSIETSPNGDIVVCSSVKAVNVLPHAARRVVLDHAEEASGQHHHSQLLCPHQRQKSPSYQRRLRQRAAARAAVTAEQAVQTITEVSSTCPCSPPTYLTWFPVTSYVLTRIIKQWQQHNMNTKPTMYLFISLTIPSHN